MPVEFHRGILSSIPFAVFSGILFCGISVPPNKRNGRKQVIHLERARAVQKIDYPNGEWRDGNGRKPKNQIVYKWK